MLAAKIRARDWLLFILLAFGLIVSLVYLAFSLGEQYDVDSERFRLIFALSIVGAVVFSILLIPMTVFLKRRIRVLHVLH